MVLLPIPVHKDRQRESRHACTCASIASHWPFRVLPAGLNMQLGALRELRGGSLAVNTSFSRVRSRKRHEKRAPGHSLLHNLIALASMVQFATLNMQLGALRDQRQLRESCFLKIFVCRRLWNVAASLQRRKQPKVTARRARLGSKQSGHGAGWCLPPRVRSLEPCAAKCSKKSGACEMGRRAYTPPNAPGRARATSLGCM